MDSAAAMSAAPSTLEAGSPILGPENHEGIQLDCGVVLVSTDKLLVHLSFKTSSFKKGLVVDKSLQDDYILLISMNIKGKSVRDVRDFQSKLQDVVKGVETRVTNARPYLHVPTESIFKNSRVRLDARKYPQFFKRSKGLWMPFLPIEQVIPYLNQWTASRRARGQKTTYVDVKQHLASVFGFSVCFVECCRSDFQPANQKDAPMASVGSPVGKKRPASDCGTQSAQKIKKSLVAMGENLSCNSQGENSSFNSQGENSSFNSHNKNTVTANIMYGISREEVDRAIERATAPIRQRVGRLEGILRANGIQVPDDETSNIVRPLSTQAAASSNMNPLPRISEATVAVDNSALSPQSLESLLRQVIASPGSLSDLLRSPSQLLSPPNLTAAFKDDQDENDESHVE